MPIYEYICRKCGAQTEMIQKASEAPLATCAQCGGEVYRPISRTSFQLKGSGWYKDGYGSSAPKAEPAASGGEKPADTKKETPAAKSPDTAAPPTPTTTPTSSTPATNDAKGR